MIIDYCVLLILCVIQFAEHGGTVVLWDIDKDELQKTCSQITSQGYKAFAFVVDCSKKDEIYQTAERVKEEVGNVSVLVNNVGIVNCKSILELKDEEILQTVDINFLAHYWVSVTSTCMYDHVCVIDEIYAYFHCHMTIMTF